MSSQPQGWGWYRFHPLASSLRPVATPSCALALVLRDPVTNRGGAESQREGAMSANRGLGSNLAPLSSSRGSPRASAELRTGHGDAQRGLQTPQTPREVQVHMGPWLPLSDCPLHGSLTTQGPLSKVQGKLGPRLRLLVSSCVTLGLWAWRA